MAQTSSNQENKSEIDFDFVHTIRSYYPAIYKKNIKEYSNRDITRNSWEGLSERMGNMSVQVAQDWWKRLLSDYNAEKIKRSKEERSGSAMPVKREHFALYDMMKDMLSTSQASRPSTSNYKSSCIPTDDDHRDEEEQSHNLEAQNKCYSYKAASGRSGRKKNELQEAIRVVDETVLDCNRVIEQKRQSVTYDMEETPNKAVGDLIFCELQQMESEKAGEKRKLLLALVAKDKS